MRYVRLDIAYQKYRYVDDSVAIPSLFFSHRSTFDRFC